jgi:hypothetical protein
MTDGMQLATIACVHPFYGWHQQLDPAARSISFVVFSVLDELRVHGLGMQLLTIAAALSS